LKTITDLVIASSSSSSSSAAAAQQQPPAAQGSPEVVQALTKMGYTAQQAAALAAKVPPGTNTSDAVKQILQGKIKSKIKRQILEKSQQLTDNSTIKNYGYGLEFGIYKGLPYKFHEGATGAC
jgi:hypothetical protein